MKTSIINNENAYEYEVFDAHGKMIDRGITSGHRADEAMEILHGIPGLEEVTDIQYVQQEPGVWSYEARIILADVTEIVTVSIA